uniref:NADH-ubiquinone oxidoreductase chain 2 n=1 Tax=Ptyodactylus guttatus TaxID=502503 RepID=A0A1Y1CC16_9SAUR|nr:NADH dehydrogenase subunit 2 [Ptyodactylus guttatus]BAX77898.1 NADH dehydrogenase subunit 2 [Ptyodactylus guttatus]
MNPAIWTILISSLATGTIITMSSHHWLLAWLGLELNTLSLLPIIARPHHPRATEATTKYFLIQATAAALILFSGSTNAWLTGHWTITQLTHPLPMTTMTFALTLKLGLAPAHAWYPEVLQGSTMTTALIISTWQKLAPLSFMYMTLHHLPHTMILLLGLFSALLGGWAGLNQTQMRKVLAFSSIAHMGWVFTSLTLSPQLTTLTIIMYMLLTLAAFLTLNMTSTKTMTDLGTTWTHSPPLQTMLLFNLLSLGGLPPLMGFTPKLLILKDLSAVHLLFFSTGLIIASLPSLYFYTRLAYFTTLTLPPQTLTSTTTWRFKTTNPLTLPPTLIMTTLALPLTPLLYSTT